MPKPVVPRATSARQQSTPQPEAKAAIDFPVVGIGACGGSVAMMFFGVFIGVILQVTHGNYVPVFLIAGSAYLVAFAVIQVLVPKLGTVSVA